MIRVRNPEQDINSILPAFTDPVTNNSQWALAFSYDNNSNLSSKTDPRNIALQLYEHAAIPAQPVKGTESLFRELHRRHDLKAKTHFYYDEYALTNRASITGWQSPVTAARGNLTSTSR